MTGTEIVVVIGGLVVGYWIVAVVLPSLDADTEGDEPTVRREL